MNNTLKPYNPSGFALSIFKDRYAIHENETFADACRRVAAHIASAEDGDKIRSFEERFYEIMLTNRFSPGGRIWRGSGRKRANLINCFVLPAEDSREGWGKLLYDVTVITGMGGGIGINFTSIRPRGIPIKGTGGVATGAISLMKIVNSVCNELREGGGRRSALMFCLRYDHPDIEEFLHVKLDKQELKNANISILIDEEFIRLVEKDDYISLRWAGQEIKRIKARWLYDKALENSLQTGDPGFLNFGIAEEQNNLHYIRPLSATNPCGEQPLPPYSLCDLGSIVLPTHITKDGEIDWAMLDDTIRLSVRFLDNVLDKTDYPLPEIKQISQNERRIGLGVIGLHDAMIRCGIKYSSPMAVDFTDKIWSFIKRKAYEASIFLAVEKGQFSLLDRQKFIESGFCKKSLTPALRKKILEYGIRNCTILTQPPTGTTSIVAECSSGTEPMFAPVYIRNFNKHKDMHSNLSEQSAEVVIHPLLYEFINQNRAIDHFEGAHDITPDQHIRIQHACQKHIDSAVSKTINLPEDTTIEQLSDILLKNIKTLKGITIYRDGSKGKSPVMPLSISESKSYLEKCKVEAYDNGCIGGKCEV